MSRPVRPSEVTKAKKTLIPPEVYDAFNETITKHWDGSVSTFKAKEVAALIASKLEIPLSEVYNRHLLDMEDVYRAEGWIVRYDQPAYCETYEATFEFSAKRSSR